jgi:hypothetical protein
MGDHAAGALRWGREEQESIAEYLQHGKIDFSRLNSAEYLQNIQRKKPIMQAISRVQGHANALENIGEEQKQISFIVKLPFPVDSSFCRRDHDWGHSNRAEGVSIGVNRHDNQEFWASNQAVWILHVELTSKARPKSTPSKPTQFGIFVDNA